MNKKRYVPLLKGKQGELNALATLSSDAKARMMPLLDVPPIQWDHVKRKASKTLEAHLESFAKKLGKAWATDDPVFIDLFDIKPSLRCSNGDHPLKCLSSFLEENKINVVFVAGTSADRDEEYQREIFFLAKSQHQLCLRIVREDMDDLLSLKTEIKILAAKCKLSPSNIHLIFDLRSISKEDVQGLQERATATIQYICDKQDFATVTLAASTMPDNLGKFGKDEINTFSRLEISLWETVKKNVGREPNILFGDYGVAHPDPFEMDPRIISSSANIRYTLKRETLIVKGQLLKKAGFQQFHFLSRKLVKRKEYLGEGFSWGDGYIAKCAERDKNPGSLTTWRQVGTNHHLTLLGQIFSQ